MFSNNHHDQLHSILLVIAASYTIGHCRSPPFPIRITMCLGLFLRSKTSDSRTQDSPWWASDPCLFRAVASTKWLRLSFLQQDKQLDKTPQLTIPSKFWLFRVKNGLSLLKASNHSYKVPWCLGDFEWTRGIFAIIFEEGAFLQLFWKKGHFCNLSIKIIQFCQCKNSVFTKNGVFLTKNVTFWLKHEV